MNYTSAAVGIIMLIAAATWLTTGRKHFTGPQVQLEGRVVDAVDVAAGPEGGGKVGEKAA